MNKTDLALHLAFSVLTDIIEYEGGAKCACDDAYVMERVRDAYEHLDKLINAGKIYKEKYKNE